MLYEWNLKKCDALRNLSVIELSIKVLNGEKYDDQDYPDKPNFYGHWRQWRGVEIMYEVNGRLIKGHRGKTVWYIPAKTDEDANALKIGVGQALKIVKYFVKDSIEAEYHRLLKEFAIQKTLKKHGLAPDIYETLLVKNRSSNTVEWFDEKYHHPEESIYLTQIVEHIEGVSLPDTVEMDEQYYFHGKDVEQLKQKCMEIGVQYYDVGLGNLLCDQKGDLKVIDIHKWDWNLNLKIPNHPEYLQIELNNTCNASCEMCGIPNMKRKKGYMSDELFVKILREANRLGIKNITPFLHGEPFLRDDFIDKLELINQYVPSAKIAIFTNGSKLTKDKVQRLKTIKNIERFNFSFPGGNKMTYEQVTGLKFEETKANILYALEHLGFKMTITMPKFEKNIRSSSEFLTVWGNYDAHTYDAYHYVNKQIKSEMEDVHTPCDRILRSMTILWDGRVNICCLDAEGEYVLGDINDCSIEEVWQTSTADAYREQHLSYRHSCLPCKGCNQEMLPPKLQEKR